MIDVIDVDDELAGVADEEGEHQEDEDAGKLRLATVVRVSLLKPNSFHFLLVCIKSGFVPSTDLCFVFICS